MRTVNSRHHLRIAVLGLTMFTAIAATSTSVAAGDEVPTEAPAEAPAAATAQTPAEAPAPADIASGRRRLDRTEVRAAQVLPTAAEQGRGPKLQAFQFGNTRMLVSAGSPIEVDTGVDASGATTFEVRGITFEAGVPQDVGYLVPPNSAFVYNNEGYSKTTVGTWVREYWWTINKANDYSTSTAPTKYDYYRSFIQLRAASVTGATSTQGYKQAWVELDLKPTTLSYMAFEPAQPNESYAGVTNQTTKIGFSTTAGIKLGAPPLEGTLGAQTSWEGSMTSASENWHPVIRSEVGSGGVMWCRYTSAEFTGTKIIAARESTRFGSAGGYPGHYILTGQRDVTTYCPSQI